MNTYIKPLQKISFPNASGININMMSFVMGDSQSVPETYKQYIPLIDACSINSEELGKIGYLTISEGLVAAGNSQRRGGTHVEKHPSRNWGGGSWGGGYGLKGGIYIASTVDHSTAFWNTYVDEPNEGGEVHGFVLEDAILSEAERLYWMTDGTPHEALQQSEAKYRQFFRLVTSDVSLWYQQHSTCNSLGVVPPSTTRIIKANKFS